MNISMLTHLHQRKLLESLDKTKTTITLLKKVIFTVKNSSQYSADFKSAIESAVSHAKLMDTLINDGITDYCSLADMRNRTLMIVDVMYESAIRHLEERENELNTQLEVKIKKTRCRDDTKSGAMLLASELTRNYNREENEQEIRGIQIRIERVDKELQEIKSERFDFLNRSSSL